MPEISFSPDDSLYRDRDKLSEDYTPEEIVGRDDEIQRYHTALQPVINGEDPNNIFLYGKTGVGKTAVTRHLLEQLEADAGTYDVDLTTIELNCEGLTSSYQVAIKLVNELRDSADRLSNTGHPMHEVLEQLFAEFDEVGGTILIVLDEVDNIGDDDSLLYQLPRARSNGNIEDVRLGVIGISNDLAFRENLRPEVKSSLAEVNIRFPPYDAEELRQVLTQRVSVAFYEEAIADGVIQLCAAYGAKDGGDARKALDLLRAAADHARAKDATIVDEDDVDEARRELEREEVMDGIADLADQHKLSLYALVSLQHGQNEPSRSKDIYERYQELCDISHHDARTLRRVRDFLGEIEGLGVINSIQRNQGYPEGKHRAYELGHDEEMILAAMSDLLNEVGVHETVVDIVEESNRISVSV
ncbi:MULTISPECIES: orc1/cdc6 family replication initiation protein [Halorubrum]|uniref:orc1/cdc6 family replication initiation protein n=1 Tax=Halorubrum TaxID=56688 RepID=UPI0023304E23|nr:orc1/cdc6 family replication initiation protein [Halorubrum ezzemoulense]MDB2272839.1 orc1/cdc6 family replication initiation protein [Halorubrum ezzemoulense]